MMENTNDSLHDLRMQEILLLQEIEIKNSQLKLLRMKMEYLRSSSDKQEVNPSPRMETCKNEASPVSSFSTGKDGLNPCVDSLQKTVTKVQTSINVGKREDLNLRPNGGIQIPKIKEQSLNSPVISKNYYVVFNGPYPGIYLNWDLAEQAVKGHSGVKHKKFKSYDEAKAAASIFTTSEQKAPLELIRDNSRINPYKTALAKVSNLKIIGKLPAKQQVEFHLEEDSDFDIKVTNTWEDFAYLYSIARNATPKQFQEEKFYTTDKNNISYINIFPGADPELPYEAYQFGLLSTIYPGDKLEEIQHFPENFRTAILQFKKKCLSKTQQIFIKFQSTTAFWEEHEEMDNFISPYNYVNIGAVKERIYSPSKEMPISVEKRDLKILAEEKMLNIIERLFNLPEEPKLHINMSTYTMLVTSSSHKGMTPQDKKKLEAFKERVISPLAMGRHNESFCKKKEKLLARLGDQYVCRFCTAKEKVVEDKSGENHATSVSGASTSTL